MEEITLKNVMECFNKGYMQYNFNPIQFFKTDTRLFLDEKEEYVCISADFNHNYMGRKGLYFTITKKSKEYPYSIVNGHNIRQLINEQIYESFHEMEVEKGKYDNDERYRILEKEYYNLPVFYKILGSNTDYKSIWATKNRYRTKIGERQCMRFYFCINDCEHCKYWDNWCTNVVSDNYDCKAMKDECHDFVDIKVGD